MSIFTTNILKTALNVIPKVTIKYRKFNGKSLSDFGVVSMEYGEWDSAKGMIEPGIVSSFGGKNLELSEYRDLGLDWSRRYITIWIPDVHLENTVENEGCDQVFYNGHIFNVIQIENWEYYDGWMRCYCVENKSLTQTE